MPELAPSDVEAYTNGRLLALSTETGRLLNAALAVARHYVGWHVSPVKVGDVATIDGPGGYVLPLPTRRLLDITDVTEDATALDVTKLNWSVDGYVRKVNRQSWSCKYRGVVVTMNHGYTEEEAADWRQAILDMVDQMSVIKVTDSGGGGAGALKRKKVDNVEQEWFETDAGAQQLANQALFTVQHILDHYRLVPVVFL